MIIYKITNKINGKVYIGQTTRSIEERMREHLRKDKIAIDKAIKKYGIDNFIVEVIDKANSIEILNDKERYYIKLFDTYNNGYNSCLGGCNSCGYQHTIESRAKMSAKRKGLYIGENNPFYNRSHTEEAKKVMSNKRVGMCHLTKDQITKLRNSHYKAKVKNIDSGEIFNSIKEASQKYNIAPTHITRVCKGKRKSCGGYHWQYA